MSGADNSRMARLLIIAHAPLASALRSAGLHVFPDAASDVLAMDVSPDEAPDLILRRGRALIARLQQQEAGDAVRTEVLVLADLFGATPCNAAQRLVADARVRLITGANLPMLLRALTYRHEPLEALTARATAGATQGVMVIGATAPQMQPSHRFLPHDQSHGTHQQ